ncbi:MAG: Maf family protein [Burkholderiaceae bacterium]
MKPIYLASRSPRRRELLKQIGVRFETLLVRLAPPRGADVDEVQFEGETANDYVVRTAREKAEFGAQALRMRGMLARPVLSADTVVILDGEVLGKPADAQDAATTLRRLSGRSHEVRTAVAIAMAPGAPLLEALSISTVRFRTIAEDEIRHYVGTGEPYDKAGAYGIQGHAGIFVERIEGSYTGIMGLPVFETAELLGRAGIRVI